MFQNPPKAKDLTQYENGYFGVEKDPRDMDDFLKMKQWSMREMIKPALKQIELGVGARVVDVGCGLGALLDVLSAMGFESYGVEVRISNWRFANSRHPDHLHLGSLESAAFKDDFFDLVVMFDVIEHLQDPGGTLNEVRRVLKPGGRVYIVTPNISSINSRLLGSQWYQYKPNEHLFYFSPRSLDFLLRHCGFVDVRLRSVGVYTNVGRLTYVSAPTSPLLSELFYFLSHRLRLERVRIWIPSGHLDALARKAPEPVMKENSK